MNGKLLVIEGSDGAGKATQTALLVNRLRANGRQVEQIDFPRYTTNFFGKFLRDCLDGKHGTFATLDPRIASLIYAADRYESSQQIREWLESGVDVVADRYVSANMLHQGSKINDKREREAFLRWLHEAEYKVFGIPQPDIVIYLDVPYEIRKEWMIRDRTRGTLDTVEMDETYQTQHEQSAHHLKQLYEHWRQIDCVDEGRLLSREQIHDMVYQTVANLLA